MLDSWLGRHTTLGANDTFHFERPDTAKTLSRTLAGGGHVLLYGLARQGKTTLLSRVMAGGESVTIHVTDNMWEVGTTALTAASRRR